MGGVLLFLRYVSLRCSLSSDNDQLLCYSPCYLGFGFQLGLYSKEQWQFYAFRFQLNLLYKQ